VHAMDRFEFGRPVVTAPLLSRNRVYREESITGKATMVGERMKQQTQSTADLQMIRE
jgi:hypothetical protein